MKTLLIALLLSFSLSAQADSEKDAKAIRDLAARLFIGQAASSTFNWENVSCEHLMKDAFEVATEAYFEKKNNRIKEIAKSKRILY